MNDSQDQDMNLHEKGENESDCGLWRSISNMQFQKFVAINIIYALEIPKLNIAKCTYVFILCRVVVGKA